jgi:hypothetical protein
MVVRRFKTELPDPTARVWPTWLLYTALVVLFFGPLAAPLFQATRLPLLADSGALAHDLLAQYVCPTPAKSYVLLAFPMAVCARCWGATLGLWLAWLLVRRAKDVAVDRARSSVLTRCSSLAVRRLRSYHASPWSLRMGLAGLALLLWTIEINGWAAAPRALLLLNGANAGFWAGLFLYSIWPGMRHAWAGGTHC